MHTLFYSLYFSEYQIGKIRRKRELRLVACVRENSLKFTVFYLFMYLANTYLSD